MMHLVIPMSWFSAIVTLGCNLVMRDSEWEDLTWIVKSSKSTTGSDTALCVWMRNDVEVCDWCRV